MSDELTQAVGAPLERHVRPAVAEALRLAHAYADAKLIRYGLMIVNSPADPHAAFDALSAAIGAIVGEERERMLSECIAHIDTIDDGDSPAYRHCQEALAELRA